MKRLNELTLKEALEGLQAGLFSSEELTTSCLSQIKKEDVKIKAFITVLEVQSLNDAKGADLLIKKKGKQAFKEQPLLGIPYSLKDNFCTKGIRTTASSNVLKNFTPPYESTVSEKLRNAGAILLGKTNMDSFAHGSSTESSDFFTTRNPHDHNRLPGGSSGGSAASVAANMCIFSVGSETAGSIRQPASWCGVVGFKPTYGRVSRYGVIAMASSTDSPGPITKTVEDAATVLSVIAGHDSRDSTSSLKPVGTFSHHIEKLRVGVAKSYFSGVDKSVLDKVSSCIELLKKAGCEIEEVELLPPEISIAVYTILQRSEVSSNLGRFDGIRFGSDRDQFNEENKKRIMMGTYTLSAGYYDAYYVKAQKVRTLLVKDFEKAFRKVDVIAGPVTPCTALEVGSSEGNAMFGELQDALLEPSSIAGLPGISLPCGVSEGLPVGFSLIADRFREDLVLSGASLVERML